MAQWPSSPPKDSLNSSRLRRACALHAILTSISPTYNSLSRTIGGYEGHPGFARSCAYPSSGNRSFGLAIIGAGPDRRSLEELAQKLQLSSCVRFTGLLV